MALFKFRIIGTTSGGSMSFNQPTVHQQHFLFKIFYLKSFSKMETFFGKLNSEIGLQKVEKTKIIVFYKTKTSIFLVEITQRVSHGKDSFKLWLSRFLALLAA